MNIRAPYLIHRMGPMTLYVGNYYNKETSTLVMEPVAFEECQILMTEEDGPMVLMGTRKFRVRAYNIPYSLDRLMSIDRFNINPKAVALHPFERHLAAGAFFRSKSDPLPMTEMLAGKPKALNIRKLRALQDAALILTTEVVGEMRLLSPLGMASDELDEQASELSC